MKIICTKQLRGASYCAVLLYGTTWYILWGLMLGFKFIVVKSLASQRLWHFQMSCAALRLWRATDILELFPMNFEKKNWAKDKILFLKTLTDKHLGRLWEDEERQEKWKRGRRSVRSRADVGMEDRFCWPWTVRQQSSQSLCWLRFAPLSLPYPSSGINSSCYVAASWCLLLFLVLYRS